MRSFHRSLAVVGLSGLVAASFATSTAGAHTRASTVQTARAGVVGSLIASPARTFDPAHAPVRVAPTFPRSAYFNRPTVSRAQYAAIKQTMPTGVRSRVAAPAAPRTATSTVGFNGITQATAQSTWPPDINGAVSTAEAAEIVNQHLTVWKKTSPATQLGDRSLATITGYTTQSIFDPRLLYDATWKRWVATAEAFPESSTTQLLFIMVSKSIKAEGAFTVYAVNAGPAMCGNGVFLDYPQLGMNQDGIVITANCFNGNTYTGARTIALAKAIVYNGLGFSTPVFATATADDTVTPSQVFDQNPNMDMLSRSGPHLVRLNNPSGGFYATISDLGAVAGATAPSTPRAAGQQGCTTTSCLLDTGDGRFVAPGVEYGNKLWNAAAYSFSGTDGSFATPTWLEVNTSTHATIQTGKIFLDACSDDFNVSIQAGNDDRAWMQWTSTDPNGSSCGGSFVRQVEATRLPADAAGTFPSVIVPFTSPAELTGNFDSNFGMQRWGDTSSLSRDPSSTLYAWSWNESVPSGSNWGTRVQKVKNS